MTMLGAKKPLPPIPRGRKDGSGLSAACGDSPREPADTSRTHPLNTGNDSIFHRCMPAPDTKGLMRTKTTIGDTIAPGYPSHLQFANTARYGEFNSDSNNYGPTKAGEQPAAPARPVPKTLEQRAVQHLQTYSMPGKPFLPVLPHHDRAGLRHGRGGGYWRHVSEVTQARGGRTLFIDGVPRMVQNNRTSFPDHGEAIIPMKRERPSRFGLRMNNVSHDVGGKGEIGLPHISSRSLNTDRQHLARETNNWMAMR